MIKAEAPMESFRLSACFSNDFICFKRFNCF